MGTIKAICMKAWTALCNEWEREGREHPLLSRLMWIGLTIFIFLKVILTIISIPIPPAAPK
jgi:hypothetical protein